MFTLEEYKDYYYKRGKCIDQILPPKNTINDRTLESKYNLYVKKEEKKLSKSPNTDERWVEVRTEVFKRDKGQCQLLKKLPYDKVREIKINSYGLWKVTDPAHIMNKSTYRALYYEADNIICLNRFSHSMIDFNKHPITGKAISTEEAEEWWKFIVGEAKYNKIYEKAKASKRQ